MSVEIEVLRAFSLNGERVEPGRRIAVGDGLATELISAGKAIRAKVVPRQAPPAQPDEPKPAAPAARAPLPRRPIPSKE